MDKKAAGDRGEALAGGWYRENGYQILDKNFRTRLGEIDLVLQKDGVLVFCEVKARNKGFAGGAAMAVTPAKQRRVIRAAQGYLELHQLSDPVMRFDIVEVYYNGSSTKINIIENAFSL